MKYTAWIGEEALLQDGAHKDDTHSNFTSERHLELGDADQWKDQDIDIDAEPDTRLDWPKAGIQSSAPGELMRFPRFIPSRCHEGEYAGGHCYIEGPCDGTAHSGSDSHPAPLSEYAQVHDEEGDLCEEHCRWRKDADKV